MGFVGGGERPEAIGIGKRVFKLNVCTYVLINVDDSQ